MRGAGARSPAGRPGTSRRPPRRPRRSSSGPSPRRAPDPFSGRPARPACKAIACARRGRARVRRPAPARRVGQRARQRTGGGSGATRRGAHSPAPSGEQQPTQNSAAWQFFSYSGYRGGASVG
eukprot:5547008-Prymnesium_polylepis.1